MRMKLDQGDLYIASMDNVQYQIIKSWGLTKYNRAMKWVEGPATLELLDRLSSICVLPGEIEARRQALLEKQRIIDAERANEDPKPLYEYPVRVPLFKHQIRGANMALLAFGYQKGNLPKPPTGKGFGELFEMGCGKTLTAIAIMGAAYQMGAIKRVLIVCPTSVCPVWDKDINEQADFVTKVNVLSGTKEKRIKDIEWLNTYPMDALRVAVINYESVWREGLFEAISDFAPDMIIADESQRIKSHTAQQSKAMHTLGDAAKYKLILSGTPVQNNAIDIFSQYRFLDPTVFGTNYYAFRGKYAIMGGFDKKQIIGYKDLDGFIKKEYSIAYRVTKADALDLPEQTFITRNIPLEGKMKELYTRLKRDAYTEIEGGSITAPTVLTKLLRLQQFTGGFLQPDEGGMKFVYDGKLKALEDIIDDYVISEGKKLVIFCRFRPEIDLISGLIEKKKLGYQKIYGDVKISARGEIVEDFQRNPQTKIFLAQIDTAGLGITLTAADTCVYYSANFNYAAYSQSLARIHRIGQRNTCTYIHLVVEHTIDSHIYQALAKKEDLAHAVVDNWKRLFD